MGPAVYDSRIRPSGINQTGICHYTSVSQSSQVEILKMKVLISS